MNLLPPTIHTSEEISGLLDNGRHPLPTDSRSVLDICARIETEEAASWFGTHYPQFYDHPHLINLALRKDFVSVLELYQGDLIADHNKPPILKSALQFGSSAVIIWLLRKAPQLVVPEKGESNPISTPISTAISSIEDDKKLFEVIGLFLEISPSLLDYPDYFGVTPLHKCVYNRRVTVMEHLIGLGCQRDPVNAYGNTPLDIALISGVINGERVGMLCKLLRLGCRPAKGKDEGVPLQTAWFIPGGGCDLEDMFILVRTILVDIQSYLRSSSQLLMWLWNGAYRNSHISDRDARFKPVFALLVAAGCDPKELAESAPQLLPTEGELADLRYQIHFADSLVGRLLR